MINIRQSSGYGTVVHRNIYDNDDNGDDDSDQGNAKNNKGKVNDNVRIKNDKVNKMRMRIIKAKDNHYPYNNRREIITLTIMIVMMITDNDNYNGNKQNK